MCLEELSKNHDNHILKALKICGDMDYAKDVVQDMYIRIYEAKQSNPDLIIRDVYVWVTIYNIIKDNHRLSKKFVKVPIENILNLSDPSTTLEFDDTETMYLNRAKEFRYLDRGLLIENYYKSLREIEADFKINYGYIYRILKKTRKLILRDKYEELYSNNRLKHQKKFGKTGKHKNKRNGAT